MNPERDTISKINEIADGNDSDRLRDEVVAAISKHGLLNDNGRGQYFAFQLDKSGVLASLAINESEKLDLDGDGALTFRELKTVEQDPDKRYDLLTRIAASYLRQNYEAIHSNTGTWLLDSDETLEFSDLEEWNHASNNCDDNSFELSPALSDGNSIGPNNDNSSSTKVDIVVNSDRLPNLNRLGAGAHIAKPKPKPDFDIPNCKEIPSGVSVNKHLDARPPLKRQPQRYKVDDMH